MKHTFLDLYREGHSPVHRLEPRSKFLATLAFILAASLMPAGYWPGFAALALVILGATLVAGVPLRVALGRSLVVLPFALMAAASLPFTHPGAPLWQGTFGHWRFTVTGEGLEALAEVLARAWLSILAAGLLTATTPFNELVAGLQGLGLPRILAALISFLYRYLFVLVDEAERLWRAREARSAPVAGRAGGTVFWRARVLGGIIGNLFIRSYERSERVYQAMLARGFRGELRSLRRQRVPLADLGVTVVFCLALAALVVSGRLIEWGG